jgi:hypothetical protein
VNNIRTAVKGEQVSLIAKIIIGATSYRELRKAPTCVSASP